MLKLVVRLRCIVPAYFARFSFGSLSAIALLAAIPLQAAAAQGSGAIRLVLGETVKFVEHEGRRYVVDGHHRLLAARQLGIGEVPVEQVQLPYLGYKTIADLEYSFH